MGRKNRPRRQPKRKPKAQNQQSNQQQQQSSQSNTRRHDPKAQKQNHQGQTRKNRKAHRYFNGSANSAQVAGVALEVFGALSFCVGSQNGEDEPCLTPPVTAQRTS